MGKEKGEDDKEDRLQEYHGIVAIERGEWRNWRRPLSPGKRTYEIGYNKHYECQKKSTTGSEKPLLRRIRQETQRVPPPPHCKNQPITQTHLSPPPHYTDAFRSTRAHLQSDNNRTPCYPVQPRFSNVRIENVPTMV
ncbi:hypothetical protein MSG28_014336 [Choristoneura fumiferana]|uniref:Uncharacterized protein n=1 Tax=Choristoneura fumiferana TaxID=7141 RepID=A0ACC0JGW3_CHOFU|nr:hypothetical protein MSG28_014336 [Choristoneura fumiferana]